MDGSYAWMIYIREKAHEAGKSLPAVVVTAPLLRSLCGFAEFLELAGFSIGAVDRRIFSLPKLLARTVLMGPHLHHRFVFLILFFLSLFLAIDHLVFALSFWCCLDPLRPALGARKQDNLLSKSP